MTLARLLACFCLLVSFPASAQFSPARSPIAVIASPTTVTDGAALTVVVRVPYDAGSTAYLTVKTTAEIGTSSLAITVALDSDLGDVTLCTLTAITTNTTTTALLGNSQAAAGSIIDVCDFPVSGPLSIVFTVSGTTPSFDIEADLHFVPSSW